MNACIFYYHPERHVAGHQSSAPRQMILLGWWSIGWDKSASSKKISIAPCSPWLFAELFSSVCLIIENQYQIFLKKKSTAVFCPQPQHVLNFISFRVNIQKKKLVPGSCKRASVQSLAQGKQYRFRPDYSSWKRIQVAKMFLLHRLWVQC